ncbi:hypothetical protein CI102_11104 [Trichoderma harzianum]|nr:hypothetical protein CI102_11104 [Trichoderma harzianum]
MTEPVPGKTLLAHGSLVCQIHRRFKPDRAKSAPRPNTLRDQFQPGCRYLLIITYKLHRQLPQSWHSCFPQTIQTIVSDLRVRGTWGTGETWGTSILDGIVFSLAASCKRPPSLPYHHHYQTSHHHHYHHHACGQTQTCASGAWRPAIADFNAASHPSTPHPPCNNAIHLAQIDGPHPTPTPTANCCRVC